MPAGQKGGLAAREDGERSRFPLRLQAAPGEAGSRLLFQRHHLLPRPFLWLETVLSLQMRGDVAGARRGAWGPLWFLLHPRRLSCYMVMFPATASFWMWSLISKRTCPPESPMIQDRAVVAIRPREVGRNMLAIVSGAMRPNETNGIAGRLVTKLLQGL
jgi:hypothetical protein